MNVERDSIHSIDDLYFPILRVNMPDHLPFIMLDIEHGEPRETMRFKTLIEREEIKLGRLQYEVKEEIRMRAFLKER